MQHKKSSRDSFSKYISHLLVRQNDYIADQLKLCIEFLILTFSSIGQLWQTLLGIIWFRRTVKCFKWVLISCMTMTVFWSLFVIYYLDHLSRTKEFNFDAIGSRIVIYDNKGDEINRKIFHAGKTVTIENIPPWTLDAFIAIEDRRFYDHIGIDFIGVARALVKNIQAGKIVEGASTITQQLVRNLFLSRERSLERKIKEILLAFWLETRMTKDEIMELYLNRVFFGKGSKGIHTAARTYFNKEVSELTIYESAMLAGLMKAPSRDNPLTNKKAAEKRANIVYERMIALGMVNRNDDINRQYDPLTSQKASLPRTINYALDMVYDQLGDYIGGNISRYQGEIHVHTTLDLDMQKHAEMSLISWLKKNGKKYNAHQGAIISMKPQGEILSVVGGRSYEKSQFNRAVKAKRQPGSAFKPVVFLAALQKGLTPFDKRDDRPISYKKWRPKNYKNKYAGMIELTQALQNSSNSIAIQLAHEVGVDKVVKTARMLGMTSKLHNNLSLALGTAELSLLELTSAFVPFANGGYVEEPYIIKEISAGGKVIYTKKSLEINATFDAKEVSFMNYMLGSVVAKGTGRSARIKNWEIAGKTGTTQDFKDSWFIGYSSQYITGVWVGNDNGETMSKLTGGLGAARIWKNFMKPIHKALVPSILPSPYAVRLAAHTHNKTQDPLEALIVNIDKKSDAEKQDMFERYRYSRYQRNQDVKDTIYKRKDKRDDVSQKNTQSVIVQTPIASMTAKAIKRHSDETAQQDNDYYDNTAQLQSLIEKLNKGNTFNSLTSTKMVDDVVSNATR